MIDRDIAAELDELAIAIARMKPPSNRNPHAFHEDRSELASQARSIAKRARSGPPAKPPIGETPAPVGRQAVTRALRQINGTAILIELRRSASVAPWLPDPGVR
jgi:hypothetical protein